jgi:serine-type D-Ala-D-Ala endopeptidase (penicillin-binding protein 7)
MHRRWAICIIMGSTLWAMPVQGGKAPTLAADGGPILSSKSVLVLHNASGKVLLARRANEVRPIASLTKLVAALVVQSKGLKLDAGTAITRADHHVAVGGARTRLELKWIYRNRDLLHASLMASDNRAVSASGRAVGLPATALVQAMNEYVRKMKLKKTRFRGPVGIDPANVSTAWEMSRIVRRASKDKTLSKIMAKKEYRVKPMRGYLAINYRNTNPLVGKKPSVVFTGSKTGYNSKAGYCIATVAKVARVGEVSVILLGARKKIERVYDLRRTFRWLRQFGKQRLAALP